MMAVERKDISKIVSLDDAGTPYGAVCIITHTSCFQQEEHTKTLVEQKMKLRWFHDKLDNAVKLKPVWNLLLVSLDWI